MNTDFLKDLSEGAGKNFKGIGLIIGIIVMSMIMIIGVATPVINKYIDTKGLASKIERQKGATEALQASLNQAFSEIGTLRKELANVQKEKAILEMQNKELTRKVEKLEAENLELREYIRDHHKK